jgi:hypothetical protein
MSAGDPPQNDTVMCFGSLSAAPAAALDTRQGEAFSMSRRLVVWVLVVAAVFFFGSIRFVGVLPEDNEVPESSPQGTDFHFSEIRARSSYMTRLVRLRCDRMHRLALYFQHYIIIYSFV